MSVRWLVTGTYPDIDTWGRGSGARRLPLTDYDGADRPRPSSAKTAAHPAPAQGRSPQRIPDEELVNRMRVADLELHGRGLHLKSAAERYLIKYIPKDRTAVLQRLAETREDLAAFEASLQAKKDLVAKLERDAARHDYLLGIRDDLPCRKEDCNGICHGASGVGGPVLPVPHPSRTQAGMSNQNSRARQGTVTVGGPRLALATAGLHQ